MISPLYFYAKISGALMEVYFMKNNNTNINVVMIEDETIIVKGPVNNLVKCALLIRHNTKKALDGMSDNTKNKIFTKIRSKIDEKKETEE